MSLPSSSSAIAEDPESLEDSSSMATLRISVSKSPILPSQSRYVSFSSEAEGQARVRMQPESVLSHKPTSPKEPSRSRLAPIRLSQSGSFASLFMSARSKSRSKASVPDCQRTGSRAETSVMPEPSTNWFGRTCEHGRPWEDYDSVGVSIPEEQKQVFAQTRQAVKVTLKRLLGCAGEIVLDAAFLSLGVMEHTPIPGLQRLSETFIAIWKAVQLVSMNRLAFLRLVQTCTTILDSIYEEVEGADDRASRELRGPIAVLERSFEELLSLVKSQVDTPFLFRYVKRDETLKAITSCNESLFRSLTLFTITVQVRTLQAVSKTSDICEATSMRVQLIVDQGFKAGEDLPPLPTALKRCSAPEGLPSSSSHRSLRVFASPTVVSRSTDDLLPTPQVMPALEQLQTSQNLQDAKSDIQDLRTSIRTVLERGNDAALLSFLGIEQAEIPEAIKTLQRTLEQRSTANDGIVTDTLHEEFIETGIDALRRMSSGYGFVTTLPFWTITKYEIIPSHKIGMGFFSEVFQGTWKGRIVAIKVLSEVTPSDLFVREIKVWKSLMHPNVLKLYGASSATGNHPWFFVSPYMKNGTLVEFLRRISVRESSELYGLGPIAENLPSSRSRSGYGKGFVKLLKIADTYRVLQEIAKGMQYLHERNIMHGDLKASNVLVDDNHKCVISDFGQSEMKSEVCRITGSSMQTGTLRWKAPELLDGSSCMLTAAIDIYAYAIVCIEVLTMGELPWGHITDDEVRSNVLEKDRRPLIPVEFTSPLLHELIGACWHRDPDMRAPFTEVVSRLQRLRVIAGDGCDPTITSEDDSSHLSPHLTPRCSFPLPASPTSTPHSEDVEFFDCSDEYVALPSAQEVDALRMEDYTPESGPMKMPEPVHYLPDMRIRPSNTNNVYTESLACDSDYDLSRATETGRDSPPPLNANFAEARNERRYRYLLEHEFNNSLTLPLWNPSSVQVGDVGYLLKPDGGFVSLFNAFKPPRALDKYNSNVTSMASYGNISKGHLRLDKRNAAQKGLDVFSGFLTFKSKTDVPIARRQSFRLRSGHKCAHIYTESAEYQYMKKLDAPKAWFQAHVDLILNVFGREHNIQKEDLFLVISLLQARDYALFVSHRHPDGQAHFNVFPAPRKGQPWGTFTSDTSVPGGRIGPSYEEPDRVEHDYASKVSLVNDPPKAVLLGRLRFKPDSMEPTTAK